MKKQCLALCAGLLGAYQVAAADVSHSAKIAFVDTQKNGDIAIRFSSNSEQCSNGNNPKTHYIRVGKAGVNERAYRSLLTNLISAAYAGKTVHIVFDDSTSNCWISRVNVGF